MSNTAITRRDANKQFVLSTGEFHRFVLVRLRVNVLEMEGPHFHHDSAVLLPTQPEQLPADGSAGDFDPRKSVTSLTVLAAALRHAETAPDRLLIAGHADTSGDAPYNVSLTQLRADCVLAVLAAR